MRRFLKQTALPAVLLALLALTVSLVPAAAQQPNRAGLVVQFGDGSLAYALVEFTEESITSEQLLTRTGLDVEVSAFGGMGAAVCSINGEGCPASNCFCRSYSSPSYFWRFHVWDGERWVEQLRGASQRNVGDGDIDGWLWSAGEASLPPVSMEQIDAITRDVPATPDPAAPLLIRVPLDGPLLSTGPPDSDGDGARDYVLFAGMLAAGLAAALLVLFRGRASRGQDIEP